MFLDPRFTYWIVGVAIGAFILGTVLTVRFLRHRVRSDERERMRADEHFFSNLRVEREFWPETRGYLFKEKWIVIRERLLYKRFPLSGWMKNELKVDETLDVATIDKLTGSLTQLICEAQTPFAIKSFIRHLPESSESAASEIPVLRPTEPTS